MNDSEITVHASGAMTFAGPDAVALYRATALWAGLRMYAQSRMQPNRAWTPTAMLKAAGSITGKTYKRGQYETAAADLKIWMEAMKAAMPVTDQRPRWGVWCEVSGGVTGARAAWLKRNGTRVEFATQAEAAAEAEAQRTRVARANNVATFHYTPRVLS